MSNSTNLITPCENYHLLPQAPPSIGDLNTILQLFHQAPFIRAWMDKIASRQGGLEWGNLRPVQQGIIQRYARAIDIIADESTELLGRKDEFVRIMRELGYWAPETVVVRGDGVDVEELRNRLLALDCPSYLLKPVIGSKGRGLVRHHNVDGALEHAVYMKDDYLFQSNLPIARDYRYMIYVDTSGRRWRVGYEKRSPYFLSDGRPLYQQILSRKSQLTRRQLQALRDRYGNQTWQNIPEGTRLYYALSGNIAQSAIYDILDADEPENLDRFMEVVLDDLEKYCGRQITWFCLDLGSTTDDLLKGAYDYSRLREQMVFFEFQFFANVVIDSGPYDPRDFYDRMKALYVQDAIERARNLPIYRPVFETRAQGGAA